MIMIIIIMPIIMIIMEISIHGHLSPEPTTLAIKLIDFGSGSLLSPEYCQVMVVVLMVMMVALVMVVVVMIMIMKIEFIDFF